MIRIKDLLETDYVSHYGILSSPVADSQIHSDSVFDIEDTQSFVPFKLLPLHQGAASFNNAVYGVFEMIEYENFVNQCVKPRSFLNNRKKCDYILCHEEEDGYVILIELTSSLNGIAGLSKAIERNGIIVFPGGKYEKCEYQLFQSLHDLYEVDSIKIEFDKRKHHVCLMAYELKQHTDPQYLINHPFERYLTVESKETAENGAIVPCPNINNLGFEYRRISHANIFDMG